MTDNLEEGEEEEEEEAPKIDAVTGGPTIWLVWRVPETARERRCTMGVTWQLQEAKNRLSAVVERALKNGPQVITRRGAEVAVLVSMKDYQKLVAKQEGLGTFLMKSPLVGSGVEVERSEEPFPERVKL